MYMDKQICGWMDYKASTYLNMVPFSQLIPVCTYHHHISVCGQTFPFSELFLQFMFTYLTTSRTYLHTVLLHFSPPLHPILHPFLPPLPISRCNHSVITCCWRTLNFQHIPPAHLHVSHWLTHVRWFSTQTMYGFVGVNLIWLNYIMLNDLAQSDSFFTVNIPLFNICSHASRDEQGHHLTAVTA